MGDVWGVWDVELGVKAFNEAWDEWKAPGMGEV